MFPVGWLIRLFHFQSILNVGIDTHGHRRVFGGVLSHFTLCMHHCVFPH